METTGLEPTPCLQSMIGTTTYLGMMVNSAGQRPFRLTAMTGHLPLVPTAWGT